MEEEDTTHLIEEGAIHLTDEAETIHSTEEVSETDFTTKTGDLQRRIPQISTLGLEWWRRRGFHNSTFDHSGTVDSTTQLLMETETGDSTKETTCLSPLPEKGHSFVSSTLTKLSLHHLQKVPSPSPLKLCKPTIQLSVDVTSRYLTNTTKKLVYRKDGHRIVQMISILCF